MKSVRITRAPCAALLFFGLFLVSPQLSATTVTIYEDMVNKRLADASTGARLTHADGETVDMRTGKLTLRHVDIDLPGNSALPVTLARTFSMPRADGAFNDWEIAIPNISGTFTQAMGWEIEGVSVPKKRCSAATESTSVAPPFVVGDLPKYTDAGFEPKEYWHGYFFERPDGSSTPLLIRNSDYQLKPADGRTYPWVAMDGWAFYCIPIAGSSTNEGFAGLSPEGVTYFFDVLASSPSNTLSKYDDLIEEAVSVRRKKMTLLPSRAVDRFGNSVAYTYSPIYPGRITRVEANDGRKIDIAYDTRGRIVNATSSGRVWTYAYEGNASITTFNDVVLKSVTLPDDSKWSFELKPLGVAHVYLMRCEPISSPVFDYNCDPEEIRPAEQLYSGAVNAPSGLRTDYQFKAIRPIQRAYDGVGIAGSPRPGLIKKTISGPGIATGAWSYAYSHVPTAAWANPCGAPCRVNASSYVDPDGNRHGFVHGVDISLRTHGLLMQTDVTPYGSTSPIELTTYQYILATSGQPFALQIGNDPGGWFPQLLLPGVRRPMFQRRTTLQGRSFIWQVNPTCGSNGTSMCFDAFARPTQVTKISAPVP